MREGGTNVGAPLDVVYFVRPGDDNEELRHSLRSLTNLPHRQVWIVGHRPRWVTGVEHIPGNRCGSKWPNVYDNLQLAAAHVDAERFIVMNDDFFVMRPVDGAPAWHRGPLTDHIGSIRGGDPEWRASLVATHDWLVGHGIDEPLSYELHVPVAMDRARLGEVLELAAGGPVPRQWRTLYGNWWAVDSTTVPDCKVRTIFDRWQPQTFLSTDDRVFGRHRAGDLVRSTFPEPGIYERTHPMSTERTVEQLLADAAALDLDAVNALLDEELARPKPRKTAVEGLQALLQGPADEPAGDAAPDAPAATSPDAQDPSAGPAEGTPLAAAPQAGPAEAQRPVAERLSPASAKRHTYRHADGRTRTVTVGSVADKRYAAAPSIWQRVDA